jgi:hypothetical protein
MVMDAVVRWGGQMKVVLSSPVDSPPDAVKCNPLKHGTVACFLSNLPGLLSCSEQYTILLVNERGQTGKAGVVGFRNSLVAQCDTGPLHQGASKEKYSLGKLGGGLGNATLTI